MFKPLTKYNHNSQGNPHAQYDRFKTLSTKQALDNNNNQVWVQIFQKKLRYDNQQVVDKDLDTLRRLSLDALVFDTTSEWDQDMDWLHVGAYISAKSKDVAVNLSCNSVARDYTHLESLSNPGHQFRLYVKQTTDKDASGVPIFVITLYGKVPGSYATINLQPMAYNFQLGILPNDTWWQPHNRSHTDITTNINATGIDRISGLLSGIDTNSFITEDEMEQAHSGEQMYSSLHPAGPTDFEQVYRGEKGPIVTLEDYTTLLTVASNPTTNQWNLNAILPSPFCSYNGFRLKVLTFGGVTYKYAGRWGSEIGPGVIILKKQADITYEGGTLSELVFYNGHWIEQ
ncbi:hypothetical protein DM37_03020 [Lactiplantibacillus plantarum]|uniref:hypothetical protein n=1 Tax=Lactiplantibacillus plantarum TaxID=1590 RepID=UPI0010660D93|nr:hypothetical protein [Lactiplantibacillus plantarum]TEA96256.1 hypothetical protein DM37_03020 [Lactiplantibacillus plantarum]